MAELENKAQHDSDCTIYSAMINEGVTDGICTCGYGWQVVRDSSWLEMYSDERLASFDCKQGDQ